MSSASQQRRQAFLVGRGGSGPRGQELARKMAQEQAARRALVFGSLRSKPPAPSVVAANMGYVRNRSVTGVRIEKKVIDINSTSYAVENTGTQLQLLNGCVAGSQIFNRIGRKINLKSLQIRGFIFGDASTGVTRVRMVIVFDKQANGAAPTWANIMQSQNIAGTTASDVNAMVNLDNRDRFEIIRDLTYTLGPWSDTATQSYAAGTQIVNIDEFMKLGNRETVYNAGTAGTIGDIQSGSLYMFLISNQPAATGAAANLAFRTRFIDM